MIAVFCDVLNSQNIRVVGGAYESGHIELTFGRDYFLAGDGMVNLRRFSTLVLASILFVALRKKIQRS